MDKKSSYEAIAENMTSNSSSGDQTSSEVLTETEAIVPTANNGEPLSKKHPGIANLVPIKPGQVLNPTGRPKTKLVRDTLTKVLTKTVKDCEAEGLTKKEIKNRLEILIESIYLDVMSADGISGLNAKLEFLKLIGVRIDGNSLDDVAENAGVTIVFQNNIPAPTAKQLPADKSNVIDTVLVSQDK
jgi:hypothetical protein